MKKLLLLALAVLLSVQFASAQKKGDIYVGGLVGFYVGSNKMENQLFDNHSYLFSFSIGPEVGIFISDSFKIGLGVFYSVETSSNSDFTNQALSITPNIAYYLKICEHVYYTPTLHAGYQYSNSFDSQSSSFITELAIGSFEFKPIERLGISVNLVSVNYQYTNNPDSGTKTSLLNLNLANTLSAGLKFYF